MASGIQNSIYLIDESTGGKEQSHSKISKTQLEWIEKSALKETNGVKTHTFKSTNASPEPIAIIGMAAKLPQDATSTEAFWKMLQEGRSAMTEVPSDRFNVDAFYHQNRDRLNSLNVRGGHFVKGNVAAFDAPFFSIPRHEADSLDPQQRGLLECTYNALENAGIPLHQSKGSRTGVFVGCFAKEYDTIFSRDPDMQPKYQASGTGSAMLSNRLSWFYDFRGPSITLDTACSSSLNALHLACQSLDARDSDMAIVGGCNVILNPDSIMMSLSNLQFLSPDSLCYSFDHRANGYSRGEGFGVVVLKRLSQALADNDTIRAVIRATHSNQDGRTPGITQPSESAQAILIKETYEKAGLELETTRFFEAHGTGTQIGDTTEASAIHSVFGEVRTTEDPLIVGAVKSNIGHLEGASGLASIMKTVMILENAVIPPNINFEKVNPGIPMDKWHIQFPLENISWPSQGLRRASVNSFGYGGANAHVILDDAYNYLTEHGLKGRHCTLNTSIESQSKAISDDSRPRLLVWSAADEQGPKRAVDAINTHLSSMKQIEPKYLANLAFTLAKKRSMLSWRTFLAVEGNRTTPDISWNLCARPIRSSAAAPGLAFIFTGQGATWYAMGRELLTDKTFSQSLLESEQFIRELGCKWSLIEELQRDKASSRLKEPQYAQPICTALQIALIRLLSRWGIVPAAVIGHSSGEIAAAHCSGAISHLAAMSVAYWRGVLSSRLAACTERASETMMAVALSVSEVQQYFSKVTGSGNVSVACINSPRNVTISGNTFVIQELGSLFTNDGVFSRQLDINVAYHSPSMHRIAEEYLNHLRTFGDLLPSSKKMQFPTMYSSVTSQAICAEDLRRPQYWVLNMVQQVNFSGALSTLQHSKASSPFEMIVEIGPSEALRRAIVETLGDVPYAGILKHDRPAYETALNLAGNLWCRGFPVDLMAVNGLEEAEVSMLTNLPSYQFNHSHTYWHESRLSKNFRFRKHRRHELLGTPDVDWNVLEGKWRNIIDKEEHPWITDHGFNGSQIYPAAGMIIMALEAAMQVTKNVKESITGIRVKNVTFSKALVLSDNTTNRETHFYLRPKKVGKDVWGEQFDFRLCSLDHDEWVENCHGTVVVEIKEEQAEIDKGKEEMEQFRSKLELHRKTDLECENSVAAKQMYDNLATFGFEFGPTFRTLRNIRFSKKGSASAWIDPHEWTTKVPEPATWIEKHLIHPTALDAVFHLTVTAISKGGWQPIATMVPTFLEEMWISSQLLQQSAASSLQICSRSMSAGLREAEFNMTAIDSKSGDLLIVADRYRATAISSVEMVAPGVDSWRRLCFQPHWMPDIATADHAYISALCNSAADSVETHLQSSVDDSELICLYFISQTLTSILINEISQPHLRRYFEWMQFYLKEYSAQNLLATEKMQRMLEDDTFAESVITDVEASGPEGKVYVAIGRIHTKILRNEVDALELLFQDGLLQAFYSGKAFTANYERMRAYVDTMAHKYPNMRVLEIGAGTGGATEAVLKALGPRSLEDEHSTARFQEYVYTDISASFFENAKKRFEQHSDRLTFKTLDIERPPLNQGFEEGTYDLVVASCVLHATAQVQKTLLNTARLLKPGGKLLLFEPCQLECARLSFVFGLLPGWWLSEESSRYWSPLLTDTQWDESLRQTGFSGNDICLRDYEDHRHTFSVVVSTKEELDRKAIKMVKGAIVVEEGSMQQALAAQYVQNHLQMAGYPGFEILSLADAAAIGSQKDLCISLFELEKPLLWCIDDASFLYLKSLVKSLRYLIWINGDETKDPRMGLATGFGRSMCSENDRLDFITLSLKEHANLEVLTASILSVVRASLNAPDDNVEHEYREHAGTLHINRLVELNPVNDIIYKKTVPQNAVLVPFSTQDQQSLTLTTASPGLLSALQFAVIPDQASLGPREVEIAVKAVGVNFKNVMVALGQIPDSSLGQECSGVITAVGTEISPQDFSVGDRVFCLTQDAFRNFARGHKSSVYKIPETMTFATAAAIPVTFSTAYYSLFHLARLDAGESVLIHAAAGGVGQAAIQIAKTCTSTSNIFVTVSSDEKRKLLIEQYGILETHIFSSRHKSFVQGIKRMTSGRGVDVVLNSLAGDFLKESLECVAPLGRFVEIGKKDMHLRSDISLSHFVRSISFLSVDLGIIARECKPLMEKIITQAMRVYLDGKMQPAQPLTAFTGSQIEEAFRFLQNGRSSGKAIIEFGPDDQIPVVPSSKPTWAFDPNATYIIAGGSGGLGRSVARWMTARNAKHILLLSRSGTTSEAVQSLIRELEELGTVVAAPSCDITDEMALKSVLSEYAATMPPIRGCIQGSMVLRDGLFDAMSHDDFHTVLKPKVQGTWNLHNLLPRNMTFFTILSSTGGVFGSRGQSNYAAASTYQDAFAKYRVSLGEKCVSLDLGLMLAVGFAAERQHITDKLISAGYEGIHEIEFHAMLDHFCDPERPIDDADATQTVTGVAIPASLNARGIGEIFWMSKPLFQGLRQMDRQTNISNTTPENSFDYRSLFEQAPTDEAAGAIVTEALTRKLSTALNMPVTDIEPEKPVYAYGVDSLVAVEVRYWFLKEFKAQVAVFEILRGESIAKLSLLVASKTQLRHVKADTL